MRTCTPAHRFWWSQVHGHLVRTTAHQGRTLPAERRYLHHCCLLESAVKRSLHCAKHESKCVIRPKSRCYCWRLLPWCDWPMLHHFLREHTRRAQLQRHWCWLWQSKLRLNMLNFKMERKVLKCLCGHWSFWHSTLRQSISPTLKKCYLVNICSLPCHK